MEEKDASWRYHLTRKEIALLIKRGGMTTSLSRIGMPIPHPKGAFAQDRKVKEGKECQEKLKEYLCHLLAHGCTMENIEQTEDLYIPFNFVIQGSNKADIPRLQQIERQYLARFKEVLLNVGRYDENKYYRFGRDFRVESLANTMLARKKNHFLVRLAVQFVSYKFKIEEVITATHIYFLKPGAIAVSGYKDYKKHLGDVTIVVLRVHKGNLPGLVQDDSEARAMMTHIPVTPDVIEVMVNHDNFPDENYRINDQNWQPLRNLV